MIHKNRHKRLVQSRFMALTVVMVFCQYATPAAHAATTTTHFFPVAVSTVARSTMSSSIDITVDDSGDVLYISDTFNAVYRSSIPGGDALLVAGSGNGTVGESDGMGGVARFNNPYGITCDTLHNTAYISDTRNHRIRSLTLHNNTVTTLVDSSYGFADGVGISAQFGFPWGIVYHHSGVLFVADNNNVAVRRIMVATANVTTVATIVASTCRYLAITSNGTFIYVTAGSTVMRINTTDRSSMVLAGNYTVGTTPTGLGRMPDDSSERGGSR
jgi:hypothetical protein